MRKIYSMILLSVAVLGALTVSGCKKDSSSDVVLEVFGPCPVLRGTTISFIGKNLDRVTSVIFPNNIEVTEITRTSANEIMAIVPQEATEGQLILKYPGGSITSVARIGFTEPYEITSISPTDKAIRCGDIVTIKGDYLWDIVGVSFMSDALVDSSLFTSQTRTEISVPVPAGAQSGKIKILDATGNELYSDEELTISQPTVTSVAPLEVKAGGEITLTGTNIDLIESVTFQSNKEVVIELLGRSQTSVKVSVPADAQDGTISYKSYAGISAEFGTPITLTVPSNLSVAAPDGFKADEVLVISGDDLDLVTKVTFTGDVDGTYTYLPGDGTIIVPIDPTAKDGAITLSTAAGKSVVTDPVTFVKPVITSLAPLSLTAGETFKVIGTDLDLTNSLTLGGKKCEYTIDSATELTVKTENTSVSGKVVISTANGGSVESEDQITLTYTSLVIVSSLPTTAGVDDEVTMTGANFNIIENIFFGDTKVTGYTSRNDTEITFRIPDVMTGQYNPTFVLFNGDEEMCPMSINVTGRVTLTTIWEGTHDLGSSWGNAWQTYDGSAYNFIRVGSTITFEFITCDPSIQNWWQLQIMDGTWTKLSPHSDGSDVVNMTEGQTSWTFTPTYADLLAMKASGFVLNGTGLTITKIYVSAENRSAEPILPTDVMINDWEPHGDHNGYWDGSWSFTSEIVEEDGNTFFRGVTDDVPASSWVFACNHQANGALAPKLDNAGNYVLKVDVRLENDLVAPANRPMQVILGDQWNGWINDFYEAITVGGGIGTNGQWVTLTFDLNSIGYSGAVDCSSGSNGLFWAGDNISFSGVCFDNFRFSLK